MQHHRAARADAQAQLFGLPRALHDFQRVIEQAVFDASPRETACCIAATSVASISGRDAARRVPRGIVAHEFPFRFRATG